MAGRIKRFIRSVVTITDTPESLSRGIAIGFFFGVSMFWGLQIILAVLFAQILWGNKKAAAIMTAVSNPITTPLIYPASYKIGHFIVNDPERIINYSAISNVSDIINMGLPFLEALLAGTVILGAAGGAACYIAVKKYLTHRKHHHVTAEAGISKMEGMS